MRGNYMLNRLPPRLHMFVRQMLFLSLGFFALTGVFAVYNGDAELPKWWFIVACVVGGALGSLFHDVPKEILAAREHEHRS
jgi:uncharacterized membrane protein AbrB (regulator of aidB expression)